MSGIVSVLLGNISIRYNNWLGVMISSFSAVLGREKIFRRLLIMKRIITILLGVIMALALVSCGSTDTAESKAEEPVDAATSAVESTAEKVAEEADVASSVVESSNETTNTASSNAESEAESEQVPEMADSDTLTEEFTAQIPSEYKDSDWFLASVSDEGDGTMTVDLQLDQRSDDEESAFALAQDYYKVANDFAKKAGATVGSYAVTVVNDGAPIGLYSTHDGNTYTLFQNGQRTELKAK